MPQCPVGMDSWLPRCPLRRVLRPKYPEPAYLTRLGPARHATMNTLEPRTRRCQRCGYRFTMIGQRIALTVGQWV